MYRASNPANVRIELGHFLKCDLKDLLIVAGAVILAGVIAAFNWKLSLIVLGVGLAVAVFSIYQARVLFLSGDVCPAVVVDSERNLVAVYTDLSKGGEPCPVVQILKQPLGRVTGGPFRRGTRLAFVALYNGYPREPNWRNFGGYLVNSGTTSTRMIERVVNSISEEEWLALKAGLRRLEQPFRPGLYEQAAI